jgi:hypothetical protein
MLAIVSVALALSGCAASRPSLPEAAEPGAAPPGSGAAPYECVIDQGYGRTRPCHDVM